MFRRHHAIVAILSLPVIALSAGCADDKKATPQVIFESRLERGGADNDCKNDGDGFDVGSFGNQALDTPVASTPIKDGDAFEQGVVSVGCSVTAAGADEFNVSASVNLSGATGGFFSIDGKFKTTGEQTGIRAIVSTRKSGTAYEQKDRACVVRYTTQFQGVAAGRVWGEVTCPKVENESAQTSCEAIAQFRFENCTQ